MRCCRASPISAYGHFLAVFLVAQIVALVSHVPGAWGVFEATVIALLAPWVEAGDLLGGLFAFRAIYYLLPLALATVALGLYETRTLGAWLGRQTGEAAARGGAGGAGAAAVRGWR